MASILKVDTIQDQAGNNIISENANVITIGASGDTITIPSGATLANSGIVTGFQSTGIDDNATSTAITIDNTQRVGIGTATPSQLLEIYGTSPNVQWTYSGDGNNHRIFSFSDDFYIRADANNTGAGNLVFQNGGSSEAMRITSSGNVGIGTSSPQEKLQINSADSSFLQLTNNSTGTADNNGLYVGVISGGNAYVGIRDTNGSDLLFQTENTERMRIDSSGHLLVGSSSSAGGTNGSALQVKGSGSTDSNIGIMNSINQLAGRFHLNSSGSNSVSIGADPDDVASGSSLRFEVDGSEAMRITNGLNVGISNTAPNYSLEIGESDGVSNRGLSFNLNNNVGQIRTRSNLSDTQTHYAIINSNGTVGTIKTVGSATQFNTSSDYRLKENVSYDFDATTRLKQLRPARFNFIADADTTVDGFLAHEVSSVVPEAISGEKDAMKTEEYEVTPAVLDDDGNVITEAVMGTREVPEYQGIDQSKLVPLLVKTIQELEARITTLENA